MATPNTERPVRVAVYETVEQAERVVHDLLAAGFTGEEVAVVCSDRHKAALFPDTVQTPLPAGANAPAGILTGGAVGAAVGGLALAASALMTGGASLLIAGGGMVLGGALVGSFAGAMATRGLEPEMVDYYDQAVQHGKILVAVDVHGEGDKRARLAAAAAILERPGADVVKLPEG